MSNQDENLFPFGNMLAGLGVETTSTLVNPAEVAAPIEEETPEVETAEVETAEVETAEEVVTNDNGTEEVVKEKKPRKKPNRPINQEDTDFVIANLKTMSYPEMAEARGLTKHQVSRILTDTRKALRDKALEKGPEVEAKVEQYILNNLTKPEDQKGNAGGEVKATIAKAVQNIYNSL